MPSWLPSIPYPPASDDGYFVPHTATIDWCEENYYATIYSAELVNSFTNLIFVWLAIVGMRNCALHGHDKIFFVAFAGYLLTGLGSFSFHSTLKYPYQLVDELSMIYTTCLMTWASFAHRRSAIFQIILGILVFALALFITLYYHHLQDPSFHQNAYAILTAVVLIRSIWIMETNMRPYFRSRHKERRESWGNAAIAEQDRAEQQRQDDRDRWILVRMWSLIALGLSIFVGGFGIWTLDNEYCSKVRQWRHEIGLPWGVLLEGHGWWHLMTGLGAYFYIVWGIWLRHCLNGRQDEYELLWPSKLASIPRIVRARGTSDGFAKKIS